MKPIFLVFGHRCPALLVLLAWTQIAIAQTWIQWPSSAGGNNHYYAFTPSATNWVAAEDIAVSWGGNLAAITGPAEQDFINRTFLTGRFEHLPVWIGLIRSTTMVHFTGRLRRAMEDLGLLRPAVSTPFEWVSGKAVSYSNWHPSQPDNFPPGEDYAAMNWHYSDNPPRGIKGDWNDAPLNGTTGFGGATDGPYYGLVERDTDPSRPVGSAGHRARLILFAALMIVLALFLARLVRRKSPIA